MMPSSKNTKGTIVPVFSIELPLLPHTHQNNYLSPKYHSRKKTYLCKTRTKQMNRNDLSHISHKQLKQKSKDIKQ